jgi:hypothetical protein
VLSKKKFEPATRRRGTGSGGRVLFDRNFDAEIEIDGPIRKIAL